MLRLLVALDFSDCSREALHTALAIGARATPAELVVLSVLDAVSEADVQSTAALTELERAIESLHAMVADDLATHHAAALPHGVRTHYTVVRGKAAEQIVAQASTHQVDAIVLGTHGRRGLERMFVGSVAESVVRTAPCSVLAVKPKKTA